MTAMEGRGLLRGGGILLVLALLRVGLTGWGHEDVLSKDIPNELPQLIQAAREVQAGKAQRAQPLNPGERLDPNRALGPELARIPGLGSSVAEAIVRYREMEGGFLRVEDLLGVPGIGPVTLARIKPFLEFSGGTPRNLRTGWGSDGKLDLNRADAAELEDLPGIGPALASRIVDSRVREGPFMRAEDLLRVPGIGPATLKRLQPLIRVGK